MTTGLQLALLGGALVGLGLSLIVWRLLPADPDPVDVVHRYSPEGVRARAAAAGPTIQASTTPDRLGIWAIKRFPASWWGKTPTKELALLRIPVHRFYGKKVLYGITGLLIAPVLSYFFVVLGWAIPIMIPVVGSLLLAIGLFLTPDIDVRTDARHARAEFGRALGAYTDLVALERLGGAGSRQAMELAAEVGDSWVFHRIGEELARSRWSGLAPWDALTALSDELGLPELDDLADIMRLSKEGSQVYSNLRARSGALRSAMLNEELAKANATGERMSMPMSLLGVVFLAILVAPQLLRVMAGG
jgi:Flp pilus assembly protein TadB